eukprot:5290473-Pleurochrysis_carterae.AAC.2
MGPPILGGVASGVITDLRFYRPYKADPTRLSMQHQTSFAQCIHSFRVPLLLNDPLGLNRTKHPRICSSRQLNLYRVANSQSARESPKSLYEHGFGRVEMHNLAEHSV